MLRHAFLISVVLLIPLIGCTESSSEEDVVVLNDTADGTAEITDFEDDGDVSDTSDSEMQEDFGTSCFQHGSQSICETQKGCYWFSSTCNGQPEGFCLAEDGPIPGPCQPCSDRTTSERCTSDGTCRWLEPGCGGDPRMWFGLPSCHPLEECNSSDQCGAGRECQSVDFNPCYMQPCAACSASTRICSLIIDGSKTACPQIEDGIQCSDRADCMWLSPSLCPVDDATSLPAEQEGCYEVSEDCTQTGVCDGDQSCTRWEVDPCPDPRIDCDACTASIGVCTVSAP